MDDDQLGYSVAKLGKEYGIVDSGDAVSAGIGAMTGTRFASFFDKMSRAGVVKRDLDFRRAYTKLRRQQGGRPEPAAHGKTSEPR